MCAKFHAFSRLGKGRNWENKMRKNNNNNKKRYRFNRVLSGHCVSARALIIRNASISIGSSQDTACPLGP